MATGEQVGDRASRSSQALETPASEARPNGKSLRASARKPGILQEPVLVLNATFEPINVTAVRRAMVLMLKGVAQAEELHHSEVRSAARTWAAADCKSARFSNACLSACSSVRSGAGE